MKGLLLYYWYTLKNKFIITTIISIFIAVISLMESSHELATIYFISSFALLITFDNEKESIKNSIMERVLPLKSYEIVGVKYMLLLFSLFLGVCFTWVYLIVADKWFDQNYDYRCLSTWLSYFLFT